MAIRNGGGLIQFLPDEPGADKQLEHRKLTDSDWQRRHPVDVFGDSLLRRIVGCASIHVNTNHRQAVRHVGADLVVSGVAPDGVIEAVENPALPFWLGVQWHPERQADEPAQAKLFAALVAACVPRGTSP